MKKKEAFDILGLPETATKEEAKKAFRNKAKVLHPDINKTPGADKDFKQANEAYQAIENNKFDDFQFNNPFNSGGTYNGGVGFDFDLSDFIGGFSGGGFNNKKYKSKNKSFVIKDIKLNETITFKESIIGCKKDITYTCDVACDNCNGDGEQIIDKCKDCNGSGRTTKRQGNIFFQQTCKTCNGNQKTEPCKSCSETGIKKLIRTVSVSINSGITDNSILRLGGMGNFTMGPFGSTITDVLISVKVSPDENLKLDANGRDVITNLSISLLEALKGCKKEVPTIDGQQEITIPSLTKNKDEIIILNMGVKDIGNNNNNNNNNFIQGSGNERVMINIEYPKDQTKLIELLETIGD